MKLFASFKTRFAVWVWNHTPTCSEMARLTSRALDQPLPLKMRMQLRLHFVICAWCRRYFKQINFLHRAAPLLPVETEDLPGRGMSTEAKQRLVQRLKQEW